MAIERPIIILGAARSGTTLLAGTVLSRHPGIVYWNEPYFIWKYGHAYRKSDTLKREDVTPKIRAYIQRRFQKSMNGLEGKRFMEKTPGNCLRMPFVLEVFPKAQIIHLIRDGRDVALSAAQEWAGRGGHALDSRKLRQANKMARIWQILRNEIHLQARVTDVRSAIELFAYFNRLSSFLLRQLWHVSTVPWGPQFPGLKDIRRSYSLLETCALQWDWSVRMARNACFELPEESYLEIHYEDLIKTPSKQITRILNFLGLDYDDKLLWELACGIVNHNIPKWPTLLSSEQARDIEHLIASTLLELGYPLGLSGPSPLTESPNRE